MWQGTMNQISYTSARRRYSKPFQGICPPTLPAVPPDPVHFHLILNDDIVVKLQSERHISVVVDNSAMQFQTLCPLQDPNARQDGNAGMANDRRRKRETRWLSRFIRRLLKIGKCSSKHDCCIRICWFLCIITVIVCLILIGRGERCDMVLHYTEQLTWKAVRVWLQ